MKMTNDKIQMTNEIQITNNKCQNRKFCHLLFGICHYFVICALTFVILPFPAFAWTTNQSADYVVGQTDMVSADAGTTAYGLSAPYSVFADSTKLYVLDSSNSRVLIYNSIPTVNNASADVVVGQTNMISGGGGLTAYNLNSPYNAYTNGTKLYIADKGSNRVLIYNNIPTVNNASADIVVGEKDMTSSISATTAYNLSRPYNVYTDGIKLYVTDYEDSRVLIYNNIPTVNNASADVVVGQTDMTSNAWGTTAYSIAYPVNAYTSGTKLYIIDYSHRVLIYNNIPTVNNASADIVVGQTDMTSGGAGTTAYGLNNPFHVYTNGTKLYTTDSYNNRTLIYNNIPTVNNASADIVVGQTDMISDGAGATAYGLSFPFDAHTDGTKLYIADRNNNRILIYNAPRENTVINNATFNNATIR